MSGTGSVDESHTLRRYYNFLTALFEETEEEVNERLRQSNSVQGSLASRWRHYLADNQNAKRNILYGKVASKAVSLGDFGADVCPRLPDLVQDKIEQTNMRSGSWESLEQVRCYHL